MADVEVRIDGRGHTRFIAIDAIELAARGLLSSPEIQAIEDRELDPSQVRQERIKLFASYLNIVAAGCAIGAAVTAPLAWRTRTPPADTFPLIFVGLSLSVSLGLHLIAQLALGRL